MTEYCRAILHPDNIDLLAGESFDVAIVDLMFNECGLSLAHHLNIPILYVVDKVTVSEDFLSRLSGGTRHPPRKDG